MNIDAVYEKAKNGEAPDPETVMEIIDYARALRDDIEKMEKSTLEMAAHTDTVDMELAASSWIIKQFTTKYPDDLLSKVITKNEED